MSVDAPKLLPEPPNSMRQKSWVPFVVVLAAAQAVWLSLKFHENGEGTIWSKMYGGEETVMIRDSNHTIIERDAYLPLESVMAQLKTWEEPLFSQQPQRPLNFLHIPKTGGTSIVVAAANAGYAWSDCMFPLRRETKNCPITEPVNNNTAYAPNLWKKPHPYVGSWWHVPIQYLPKDSTHLNPYQDQDLFVVIRNPYKRILSQYYYRCLRDPATKCFVDNHGKPIADSPQRMNQIVQQMVTKQQSSTWGAQAYFYHDSHWVPQSHYVYDYHGPHHFARNRTRLVRHVLHFEYLAEHFASLMKAYQLDHVIQLSSHKVNDRAEYETHTTVKDLTMETMQLIEKVYKDDFELGGYRMLSEETKRR